MSAHTPGPWEAKPDSFWDGSGLTFNVVGANGADICKLPTSWNKHRIEDPKRILPQHHNMRLIAAAPDLLVAVQDLLTLHIAHHNAPEHVRARAAIAAATERTP